ncbi:MAG TPA: nucleotide exchange factor GrpE [Spirochaetota bacterium]|nr:nucleotide exchange factor GrpE [Spirochaetota bacterium]
MDKKGKAVDADRDKSLNGVKPDQLSHHDHAEAGKDERRKNERRNVERRSGDDRRLDLRRVSDKAASTEGAFVDSQISRLNEELRVKNEEVERIKNEIDSFKDLLQRRQADFENYKKRTIKFQEEQKKYAIKDFAFEIILINDDLIRAFEAALQIECQGKDSYRTFIDGVSMISRRIEESLQKFGVVEIEAIGQPFNPNYHEAVEIEMSNDYNVDTVVKVYQKGFKIDEMVVRSTKVKVAKPAASIDSPGDANNTGFKENGEIPGSC